MLPATLHAVELDRLILLLTGPKTAALAVAVLQFMAWPWLLSLVLVVIYSARRDALMALEIFSVSTLTVTASLLLGFTIFFCCMHSPRHILRMYLHASMSFQRLAHVSVQPMLAVLLMASGGWYLLPNSPVDKRALQFLFVALEALTVPHMLLVVCPF